MSINPTSQRTRNALLGATLLAGLAAIPATASAGVILQYQGASFYPDTPPNELGAEIKVGAANVTIGGWGVYGQPQANGNLKWYIFDEANLTTPVYLSGPQAVSGSTGTSLAQWYDMVLATNITLLGGHTYVMGLIDDHAFSYGSSPWLGATSSTSNGLTRDAIQGLVQSGVVGNVFTNPPTLFSRATYSTGYDVSIRISAPIAEPAALAVLGVGLLGLGVARALRHPPRG
jgi:hypothetical protein